MFGHQFRGVFDVIMVETVVDALDMTSRTAVLPADRVSATARTMMSRSVTIPISRSFSPTAKRRYYPPSSCALRREWSCWGR
jgi:hypothetical protein